MRRSSDAVRSCGFTLRSVCSLISLDDLDGASRPAGTAGLASAAASRDAIVKQDRERVERVAEPAAGAVAP